MRLAWGVLCYCLSAVLKKLLLSIKSLFLNFCGYRPLGHNITELNIAKASHLRKKKSFARAY